MIIFHPWVAGVRPDDQAKCWAALAQFPKEQVLHVELDPEDPYAYARHLRFLWGRHDDILIIEHDVEPSVEVVHAIGACPHPICTRPPGGAPDGHPIMAWLGCTKFSLYAQQASSHAVLPGRHFMSLDCDLTGSVSRSLATTWHVHQEPMEHWHHA